jgi:hypothetical protein
MSIEKLRYVIRDILNESSSPNSKRLDEIGALVAAGLGAIGLGVAAGSAKEALTTPDETWIKGKEVCKKKAEFDTTLGAAPNSAINIKLSRYVMPKSSSDRAVNFKEIRARAEEPLMISIDRAYSIETAVGESVLLYTAAGSISRATKEFKTRLCTPEELVPGGPVYEKLKLAYGVDQKNFKRHLQIARINSDEKLSQSTSFNGSKHYYVISTCDNDFLRSEKEEQSKDWKKSDVSLFASATGDWLKKLFTADRSLWTPTGIGDEIEKLSPTDQAWLVDNYNKISGLFGLLGFVHPVFAVATIGMNLVLGLYYQRMQPDAKLFGIKLSTINFVGAGLCAFTGALSSTVFAKQTSDISIMAAQFTKIRNLNGLPELGIIPAGAKASQFTVQHLRNFCRLFPEMKNVNGWVKAAGGWSYATENGMLMVDAAGKTVIFSSDVKDFIIFYQKYPSIITQYIEWYQGMPGLLGKMAITGGAVLDVVTLAGIFDTPSGKLALTESESVAIDVAAASSTVVASALKRDITSDELKIFVDSTPLGSITVVNQKTKASKVMPVNFNNNELGSVISHMLLKSNSGTFDNANAKVFIVDEELYDNFELFIDYPAIFDKSYVNSKTKSTSPLLEKRSTIAYKLSQYVYVLLSTTSAREIAALKKTLTYGERIKIYENILTKLNFIQSLKQQIVITNFLSSIQAKDFEDITRLPDEYRVNPTQAELDKAKSLFPFYTLEMAMDQFPDASLQYDKSIQKLDELTATLSSQLEELKLEQKDFYEKYLAASRLKKERQVARERQRFDRNIGPKY